ncbi:MAG: hypothetical protein WCH04_14010 [Gammaproteobacteria bacterium]
MAMETATLIIKRIEWRYLKSNEVTSNRMAALNKADIKWMDVRCKNCNHEWKAKDSYEIGCFYEVANEVILDCPQCGTIHRIPREQLD